MVWFKVYGRDILSDPDWHQLTSDQKATLFELWCLASERNGDIPDLRKVCFRLHKEPEFITSMLNGLKDWFDGDIAGNIHKVYKESIREEKREEDKRGNEKIRDEKYRFIKGVF
jgi:hypothetical protein